MKRVMILLSTYNGEKYIRQQLESILKQDYPNIDIYIRDDGSSDNTVEILKEYSEKYANIKFYQGNNIGTCNSIFDLIKSTDAIYDYYAFSDQDDYWLPKKISMAINNLINIDKDIPALYCSNVTLVDENLNKLPSIVRKGRVIASFGNALIEDICTGCTSVINKNLYLLLKNHIPNFAIMHDWWFYIVAACFGEVIYDNNSYILYRQHQSNVIGAPTNYFNLYKKRIYNFGKTKRNLSRQAKELCSQFEINDTKKILADYIINSPENINARFQIFLNKNIFRQNFIDGFILKLIILFRGC